MSFASSTPCSTSPPTTLRAVLFDLDGTCVNSDTLHFETYRETLLSLVPTFNQGRPITRHQYDTTMSGHRNPDLVRAILPALPESARTHIWQTKESLYETRIQQNVPAIPGLHNLLHSLSTQNIPHYIVTNAPKSSAHITMTSIDIHHFFNNDHVVLAEDCERSKPFPDPYLKALALANVSADSAIAFEDSPSGIQAAVAAGLFTIGMRSTQSDHTLRAAGAAFTIANYSDETLANFLSSYLHN